MEYTIAEAATHLGVSADTIRRRIRRGELSARQAPRPQGHVWMVELEDQELQDNHRSNNNEIVEILRQQLAEKDRQLDARTREISELHQLLAARSLNPGQGRPWWRFWR